MNYQRHLEYVPNKLSTTNEETVEKKFFDGSAKMGYINESSPINHIEYNSDGEIFCYTTSGTMKIFKSPCNESTLVQPAKSVNGKLSSRTIYSSMSHPDLFKPINTNNITISVDHMKFLQKNTLVYSTESEMYYLSIHDNKHLRDFKNSEDLISQSPIKSISVDSANDLVMSLTSDTLNLWDIRMVNPIKRVNHPLNMATLSTGNQYAMADNCRISIFDKRNDSRALITTDLQSNFYKSMEYTPDNEKILLRTDRSYYFYSTSGLLSTFITMENPNEGVVTADSEHLLCPSKNYVFCYKIEDRKKLDSIDVKQTHSRMRMSPVGNQFILGSETGIAVYNLE